MIRSSIKTGQKRLEHGAQGSLEGEAGSEEAEPSCTFSENDMSAEACQHLSLTKTLYLRSHHIEHFVADIKKALHWAKA
jgi:hypothetical protein